MQKHPIAAASRRIRARGEEHGEIAMAIDATAPLVTIIGGSGFVGRYVAQRMARRGWRVRVAVRRPNEAGFVRPYGEVGQVEPIQCNIRDDASVAAAVKGAEVVINCVGILYQAGAQKFDAVQAEGPARVAKAAKAAKVKRFVHISAIGADAESSSAYQRSKAAGEAGVLAAFPGAVILRPSIIFGPEDQFFNRFAAMAKVSPVIPLVGADTRFQPVYVDDVAAAVEKAAMGEAVAGAVYELGGPRAYTFRDLIKLMLRTIRRRKFLLALPFSVARIQAFFMQLPALAGVPPLLTMDQVESLRSDNVVSATAKTLGDLGIRPTAVEGVIESYLYVFRPQGQYDDLAKG